MARRDSGSNIHGQVATDQTTASSAFAANAPNGSQAYTYDAAGRLSQAQDNPGMVGAEHPTPTSYSGPSAMATDAAGNGWIIESATNRLAKITPSQQITEYSVAGYPQAIVRGPDGNIWFTDSSANKVGKITPAGVITEYTVPTANSYPGGIASGPDGNLWFTEEDANYIGKITPSGTITQYAVPGYDDTAIASGSDGNIWFGESYPGGLASINPTTGTVTQHTIATADVPTDQMIATSGNLWWTAGGNIDQFSLSSDTVTEHTTPSQNSDTVAIMAASNGAIWFADEFAPAIGLLWPATGQVTEYATPPDSEPSGLAQGPGGSIWYADAGNNAIGSVSAPICTTRTYQFDKDTNRLSESSYGPAPSGACSTTTTAVTQLHSYDAADRLTDAGTIYDAFGDITSLPAANAGGAALTGTNYVDGQQQTITQGTQTITNNLNPAQVTREQITTTAGITTPTSDVISHFDNSGDGTAWTQNNTTGVTTRNVSGLDGSLAAIETGTQTNWQLPNLHGDIVATASNSTTATGLQATSGSDEYGNPLSTTPNQYSYLGGQRRQTEQPSGVIAMGLRTYVPQIGQFLQPDPAPGSDANSYGYANGDPVNADDLSGAAAQLAATFTDSGLTQSYYAQFAPVPDFPPFPPPPPPPAPPAAPIGSGAGDDSGAADGYGGGGLLPGYHLEFPTEKYGSGNGEGGSRSGSTHGGDVCRSGGQVNSKGMCQPGGGYGTDACETLVLTSAVPTMWTPSGWVYAIFGVGSCFFLKVVHTD